MTRRPKMPVKEALKAFSMMAVEHDDISNFRVPKEKRGPRHQPKKKKS